ncbi:MAG: NUMOD3 domain-containing DNA-binding protein [Candidatus Berkelbacteria bacterium]|nr:NUMOD3 domain-containing DNA-binding protein [Candidatus Berkelbacteria bacterium]
MPKGIYLRKEENNKKISERMKKNPIRYWLGKKLSEETKRKMSETNMGNRYAFGNHTKRNPLSDEHRKKLSEKKKGKMPKFIPDNKGRVHSEESKKKMSEANKGKYIGEKSVLWKGGLSYLQKQERVAGRKKPEQCELCGAMGTICFDHDHTTGKFRGWICVRCNFALGLVKDNKELLISMAEYITKN